MTNERHELELVDLQGDQRIVECGECDRALVLGPGPKITILRRGEFYAGHDYGAKVETEVEQR